MGGTLSSQTEELAISFVMVVFLVGSIGFAFLAQVNLTGLNTTQVIAWGLVTTFLCIGLGFGFIATRPKSTKKR